MIKTSNKNIKNVILEAVNELCDFVKPTYGPASNKVLIHNQYSQQIIDDGVAIARAYKSDDPLRDSIISVIKEVAIKTNDRVGDGTTSSLIMLQALMQEISKSNKSSREISEELQKASREAVEQLKSKAKNITSLEDLKKIANISFNNKKIADIIAKLVYELGSDAVITVEESNTTDTTSEKIEGLEIKSGYISPYMVNADRMECLLNNPYIFITDYRFTSGADMLRVMETALQAGSKDLLIVSEHIEGDALATIIANKLKGIMNVLAIEIPHGDKVEFIHDLAILTGAEPVTHDKSFDFSKLTLKQFGKCAKVIARHDKTTILGSKGERGSIIKAINSLKQLIEKATGYEKEKLQKRLAKFTHGVAVIKVGASTEGEAKALKFKVEDAINAVKSAHRGGVVCGAGLALARTKTSSSILNRALQYPNAQLRENSDLEEVQLKDNQAQNAVTREIGDYMKLGIIDPVEVLCAGVESAVSIASLLITTKGIIYEEEEKKI